MEGWGTESEKYGSCVGADDRPLDATASQRVLQTFRTSASPLQHQRALIPPKPNELLRM